MEYIIKLNEQQVELLQSILVQIQTVDLKYIPSIKTKKETKTEKGLREMREYRVNKKRKG